MQGNKENQSTKKSQQNTNKFNINYYNNLSADEFEVFCKRLLTLHQTGVYLPPPPKPRSCNNKKRIKKVPREYIPKETTRPTPTTFGKGSVGVSCESFGVKNCLCCLPANEAQYNIRILRSALQDNNLLDPSEIYEQRILDIMSGNNKNKSNKNTTDLAVFKINTDNENKTDSFSKYDKKIANFLSKETTRPTPTFKKGRVGGSCESFGVKNCLCCLPANEAQRNIRILRSTLQDNKPLDPSEIYEQRILDIMSENNKNKSNKNTTDLAVNTDNENKADSFSKYDKKIADFLVKTEMYEKRLLNIVSKYENKEFMAETVLGNNPASVDLLDEHDYFNNSTIIIDDENYSVPSTSFVKINSSKPKLIDQIILSDSDNEGTNTSETYKIPESNDSTNLNNTETLLRPPVVLKMNTTINLNINQDCTTTSNPIVDKINQPFTSNLHIEQNISSNIDNFNSSRSKQIDTSVSNIITIDDSFLETNNEPKDKSSSQEKAIVMDCPICLEALRNKEIMSTICGHLFCSPCITNCIRRTKKCPNCRKTLSLKSIHPIFL